MTTFTCQSTTFCLGQIDFCTVSQIPSIWFPTCFNWNGCRVSVFPLTGVALRHCDASRQSATLRVNVHAGKRTSTGSTCFYRRAGEPPKCKQFDNAYPRKGTLVQHFDSKKTSVIHRMIV
eukprot:2344502-Amphidinium_carterae.1